MSFDELRNLGKSVYGTYPTNVTFVQKVYTLQYPSASEYSELLSLENPIFATNVQVATQLQDVTTSTYLSASANNVSDLTAFTIGNDGIIEDGGALWKYIKVSGNATNGAIVTLTITGFELTYSSVSPSQETNVRSVQINVTSTMETNAYFLVAENILLSANTLVFHNGILTSKSHYTLNMKGSEQTSGYITFVANDIHNGDIITILY